MFKKILVIAAHPDDEVLGCGATIAKHSQNNDEVIVAILAEGIKSRGSNETANEINLLQQSARRANELLGVKELIFKSFPDNAMDGVTRLEVAKVVEQLVLKYQPEIIYTHCINDLNIDHRRIADAVIVATRPQNEYCTRTILSFEVPSSTEWNYANSNQFTPNWFVDVSHTMELKLKALEAYESEMRAWPHSRSIKAVEHLMRWRGATIGREAAESFVLLRNIL